MTPGARETRTFTVTYPSATELCIERTFDAPRALVWEAHTNPEYIRQWLLGPDGWSMPVCEFDAREDGHYRYEWRRDETGEQMAVEGTILEFSPIDRMAATERFDDPWYPGEVVNTSTFEDAAHGRQTALTVTTRFESEEALRVASETGMLDGMEATYDRLAEFIGVLASTPRGGALDLTYEVIELPEQRIGYLRGRLSEAQALWGEAHRIAGEAGLFERDGVASAAVMPGGLSGPDPEMEYDTAMIVPGETEIPSAFEPGRIPGGRYARATYTGPFEGLGDAWGEFAGSWLPSSGYRVASGPAFEVYRSPGAGGTPPVAELHVPIE